jgi:hypothetical protein
MTTRQLWKTSPEFRRSLRQLVMSAAGGWLVGIGVVQIGRKLPGGWGTVWLAAFIFGCVAAGVYMAWDVRRMEKERIAMMQAIDDAQRAGKAALDDVLRLLAQSPVAKSETQARAREMLKERPWLN